jgi:hypothetical protein
MKNAYIATDRVKIQNLVTNGNFANGTTGWSFNGSTGSALNNILKNTGNGTSVQGSSFQILTGKAIPGKKIYCRASMRVTNSSCTQLRMYIYKSGGTSQFFASINNPVSNNWYVVNAVITIPSNFVSGDCYIYAVHVYADAATSNAKVMEVKEVMALDLTELSLSDSTADQINTMFPRWFDVSYKPYPTEPRKYDLLR